MTSIPNTCSTTMSKEILDFIANNKIASVCCVEDNTPHCFNCFYSLLEDDNCIVFKSSPGSKHIRMLTENNLVAGTVISSEITITKVEGIQFEGEVTENATLGFKAAKSYYLRFPFAIAVPGKIWVLELNAVKYTSTTNGIKHKADWTRK
jgi:uncharacterized protein